MTLYYYRALQAGGKRRRGVVDATSLLDAKEKLRYQGVLVTQIDTRAPLRRSCDLNKAQLSQFTLQLARLVESGIPLFESLTAIEEQSREESFAAVLLGICDRIQAGRSLSEALTTYPKSFPPLYCAMVAAGESSGTLPAVLDKLSYLLDRQTKLRKQIQTAMVYPAVLAAFCLIVVFFLLTFAVPSIEGLIGGQQANHYTALVIAASHLLSKHWILLLFLFGAALFGIISFWRSGRGHSMGYRFAMRLPLLRQLITQAAMARFCRTLATLQEGGINWIDSLRLSRKVLLSPIFEEIIDRAEKRIVEGSSLGRELRKEPLIPPLAAKMVAIGEESGDVAPMLLRVATIYEEELEKSLTRLVTLAQPIILLIMGAVIGSVMLAILLPLTDMSSIL